MSQVRTDCSPLPTVTSTGSLHTTARNRTLMRCSPGVRGRVTDWPPRIFSTIDPSTSTAKGWNPNQGYPFFLSSRRAAPVTTLGDYRDGSWSRRYGATQTICYFLPPDAAKGPRGAPSHDNSSALTDSRLSGWRVTSLRYGPLSALGLDDGSALTKRMLRVRFRPGRPTRVSGR